MLADAHISYNARYNVTLNPFFYQRNNDNKQNVVCNPFCVAGIHDFSKAYGYCRGNSICFRIINVFITLIRPSGLLANKGEQGILSEMLNTHTTNTFSCLKSFFFFCLCVATKMQISYVIHKVPIIWPTKNNFPHLQMALLSELDRLLLKEYHTTLTALIALTPLQPLQPLQSLHPYTEKAEKETY